MAKTINELTELTVSPASGDFIPIVDVSEALDTKKTKKISYLTLMSAVNTLINTYKNHSNLTNIGVNTHAQIDTKLVTNGDTHDHYGGDGAQINHTTLSNIGTNTHAQIDTALALLLNPPRVRIYRNGDQSITAGSLTDVIWTTEKYDADNMWSSGATITIKTAGIYHLHFQAMFDSSGSAGTYRHAGIYFAGNSAFLIAGTTLAKATTGIAPIAVDGLQLFAVNDTFTCKVQSADGTMLMGDADGTAWQTVLTAVRVGA